MYGILKKFFEFSGRENKRKFQISIVLGVLQAIGEAMKIPAIMIILIAVTDKNISTEMIWGAVAVMAASVLISFVSKMRSTMLQTEGGYNAAAFKRVEIARHLRYLPMGYFNKNSLGEITSVTTNTMENLGNVATRVVMLTTQGMLNTAVILVMLIIFDYRIGLIGHAVQQPHAGCRQRDIIGKSSFGYGACKRDHGIHTGHIGSQVVQYDR